MNQLKLYIVAGLCLFAAACSPAPAPAPAPAAPVVQQQTEALTMAASFPPPLITAENTTNEPGTSGQALTSNANNTYTFSTVSGSGATTLPGLTDVSDTLVGDVGDFLGWDGTAWDGLTISQNTLSDTIITTPATKQGLRYNGTNWVNAQFASTDLSDFAATIVGTTDDVILWNGSAWDDGPLATTNLSNWSSSDLPATGEVGIWNAATGKYEPGAQSGGTPIETPDGLTAVSLLPEYPVTAYGASGSNTDYYATVVAATSTITLKDSAGAAVSSHDFAVGQGLALMGGGSTCALPAPSLTVGGQASSYAAAAGGSYTWTFDDGTDVITIAFAAPFSTADPVRFTTSTTLPTGVSLATTYYLRKITDTTATVHATAADATNNVNIIALSAGSGTHSVVGYTEFNYTARVTASDGSASAASSAIQVFSWAMNTGNVNNYVRLRIHIPIGSRGVIVYGRGTSGRDPMMVLEARPVLASTIDVDYQGFTAAEGTAGDATKLVLTVSSGHGIVANDILELNFTSSGDDAFDGQYVVASATSSTITMGAATWNAGMASGSGRSELAAVEIADYGDVLPLEPYKLMPNVENPNWDWAANRFFPRGAIVLDSVNNRLFRSYSYFGSGLTDADGTPTEPSWTAVANVELTDNEQRWRLDVPYIPMDDTTGASRGVLLTTVATVPSASTLTTAAAPGADISSNVLCVRHDDGVAAKACLTAMKAAGKGGVMKWPPGNYNIIFPVGPNAAYYENPHGDTQPMYTFLHLGDGQYDATYNVDARGANIRVRQLVSTERIDAQTSTVTSVPQYAFFAFASERNSILGGMWLWEPFTGGVTEHDTSGAYSSTTFQWLTDWIGSGAASAGVRPNYTEILSSTFYAPTIYEASATTSDQPTLRHRKLTLRDNHWFYGGGDGNQTAHFEGDLLWDGGSITNERRLGSHGFYLGVLNENFQIKNLTFHGLRTSGKYTIQLRGANGDETIGDTIISGIQASYCNPILCGDTTTSNRIRNLIISDVNGCGLNLSEIRKGTVSNCINMEDVSLLEDNVGLTMNNIQAKSFGFAPIDHLRDFEISNLKTRLLSIGNVENGSIRGVTFTNPTNTHVSYVNGTYDWAVSTSNSEYYLRNRATGGDPGIAAPSTATGFVMRGKLSWSPDTDGPGVVGLLANDSWGYAGATEVQTIAVAGSAGTYTVTYNGNTTSALAYNATSATVQTALQLLTGLGSVTVVESGTTPNLTHTVTMTSVVGNPPQMTSTPTGMPAPTHATLVPWLGYNTYFIKSGDSAHLDPDELPFDSIETCLCSASLHGIVESGAHVDFTLDDVKYRRTDGRLISAFGGSPQVLQRTKYTNFDLFYSGQTVTSTCRVADFGTTEIQAYDSEFANWLIRQPGWLSNSATHTPIRMALSEDSTFTLRNVDTPQMTPNASSSGWVITGPCSLVDCDIQTNRSIMDLAISGNTATFSGAESGTAQAGTTNTITLAAGASSIAGRYIGRDIRVTLTDNTVQTQTCTAYNGSTKVVTVAGDWENGAIPTITSTYVIDAALDLCDSDNVAVVFNCPGVISTGVTEGRVYWIKNTTSSAIYATLQNAIDLASAIDLTGADSTVVATFLGLADSARLAANDPFSSDNTVSNIVFAKNNRLRGSEAWKYAQLVANTNNYQLMPVRTHIFSTDASRNITGLAGGWPGRDVLVVNGGGFDAVLTDTDAGVNSFHANQIQTHTGAAVTLSTEESVMLINQDGSTGWRTIGN